MVAAEQWLFRKEEIDNEHTTLNVSRMFEILNEQYESLQSSMNNNNNNNCNNNNNNENIFGLVICPQVLHLLRTNKFINEMLTNSRGNLYVLLHENIREMIDKHFNTQDFISFTLKHIGRFLRIFENCGIEQSCFHELFLHFSGYEFSIGY